MIDNQRPFCADRLLAQQVGGNYAGGLDTPRRWVAYKVDELWMKIHAKAHIAGKNEEGATNRTLRRYATLELSAVEPIATRV